jgi:Tol biopolymer transport system component
MMLTAGTRLGPYEITALIGSGGMGEVYKAFDTRLERPVAIKIISSGLTADVNARQRFAREARVVAALSHPNICALYDIGEHDGSDFLVMEYLDGETLADRLVRGRLPLDQALRYAIEMASALAAAHDAGIIHRDLKPANVILTRSGAKLLDFGLAKLRHDMPAILMTATTTSQPLTSQGMTPGTLQYMAPEQIEGRDADAQSDIFAFGTVLYEMVSGRKAFEARTQASLVGRILESEPPPIAPDVAIPASLDGLIRTCLAKSPDARWRSAHDLLLQLRWIDQERSSASAAAAPPPEPRSWRPWYAIAAAFLALLAIAMAVAFGTARSTPPAVRARFDISLPAPLGFDWPEWPMISPNGARLAFTARSEGIRRVWVRLNDGTTQAIPGTEGAAYAFWSPDSTTIGFFAGGKLKKVDANGGPVTNVADGFSVGRGAWGRDGIILFVPRPNSPIHAVPDRGGASRPVTTLNTERGETGHQVLRFLPDGRHFLYAASGPQSAVYAASVDGGAAKEILRGVAAATFVQPGYLLFTRQQRLMAQRFDPHVLQLQGDPQPIAEHVAGGAFSASDEGTLVYRSDASYATELVWFTREGQRAGVVGPPGQYQQVAISPSGRRAALQRIDSDTGNADIWTVDLTTGILSRLTLDPALDSDPVWSADERQIAFTTFRTGTGTIDVWDLVSGRQQPLFAMAPEQPPAEGAQPGSLTSLAPARIPQGIALDDWTADGTLVVRTFGQGVYAVPPASERRAVLLADTPYVEDQAQVSADGRMIAFNSDESGRWEVYIATFPGFTQKRQVSNAGGMQPRWRRDGKELFYVAADGAMMAVQISSAPQPTATVPVRLFDTGLSPSPSVPQYDVNADGTRFLALTPSSPGGEPITFVLNWPAGVRR